MSQQIINVGSAPNDGTGDSARSALDKANDNFTELYARGLIDLLDGPPAHGDLIYYDTTVSPPVWRPAGNGATDGQVLTWVASDSPPHWEPVSPVAASTLDGLADVNAPSPANGQYLVWNGTVSPGYWEPITLAAAATTLDQLTDVDLSTSPGPQDGDHLVYDASMSPPQWRPRAPARVLISEQTPSGTGTVTFSSIPATYRDLEIVVRGRSTAALAEVRPLVILNNDTGANYNCEEVVASGATTALPLQNLANTSLFVGTITGASAPSGAVGAVTVKIYDYRGTAFNKVMTFIGGDTKANSSGNLLAWCGYGEWKNTAAVTRIDVVMASGNYMGGSIVSLYGLM